MKTVILLFCIFFSTISFAESDIRYSSDDFNIFPLTTSNSGLIEGVWTGKAVVIEVQNMDFTQEDKPYMWVTIYNTLTDEQKFALLYFNEDHENYELYVFGLGISVPLEIMIFKYTGRVASERKMRCKKGGYVMKLSFSLAGGDSQAVELQRETCSEEE